MTKGAFLYVILISIISSCVSTQVITVPRYYTQLKGDESILFTKIEGMKELRSFYYFEDFRHLSSNCSESKYMIDEEYKLKQWAIPIPTYSKIDTSYFDDIAKHTDADYLLTLKVLSEIDGGFYGFDTQIELNNMYYKDELVDSSKLGFMLYSLKEKMIIYEFIVKGKTNSYGAPSKDGDQHQINLGTLSKARHASFKRGIKELMKNLKCKK